VTFEQAKAEAERLQSVHDAASKSLREVSGESGPMGLTPDSVRASEAWKAAKLEERMAFLALRDHNKWFVKTFKKELAQMRAQREVTE